MAERINSIIRQFLAAAAIAVSLAAPVARAQIESTPDPTKTSFSQEEITQIAAYMQARAEAIGGTDGPARERARAEIQQQLRRAGVSVAFRRTVSNAIGSQLAALADGADEDVICNALFVLGEIADDSARQAVQQHTDDDSFTVRYAAAGALRRTLRVVDGFQPAIDSGRVGEMVSHLQDRLAKEPNAQVIDALTRALLQAGQLRREGYDGPANRALVAVASGVGSRLRHADPADQPIIRLSCIRVGDDLAARLQTPGTVNAELSRAAAAFGGEMLARLASRAGKGEIGEDRRAEVDLGRLAERCIAFAKSKLGGQLEEPGIAALLDQGDDRGFLNRASQFALALGGDPVKLPERDMQRIRDALNGG